MRLTLDRYRGMPDSVRAEFEEWLARVGYNTTGEHQVLTIEIGDQENGQLGTGRSQWPVTAQAWTGKYIGRGKAKQPELTPIVTRLVDEYPPPRSWRYFTNS